MISTDYFISTQERREMSHVDYIATAIDTFAASKGLSGKDVHLFVLDDRPELFRNSQLLADKFNTEYLWVDGDRGISDASVQLSLRKWVSPKSVEDSPSTPNHTCTSGCS